QAMDRGPARHEGREQSDHLRAHRRRPPVVEHRRPAKEPAAALMASPIVTITRQYASGGSDVASRIARALGWEVIDNEFIEAVAHRAGLPAAEVARREERAPRLLGRLVRTLTAASPEMGLASVATAEGEEATIARMTERIIAEASAHGRLVLVGRGAQSLLAQRPDALHVYVVASKPWRVRLAIERLGLDRATAEKTLDETDRRRDEYVKAYYGRKRDDLSNYDVVVNTERLGLDGAAALVVAEARRRGWD